MQAINELDPRLQLAVDMRISGLDIMHGELKVLMVDTENKLAEYTDHDNEQYDQTVDRLHLEGYLDALSDLYQLTYQLSFAIMDKEKEQE
jgi:hypothetical protein